MEKVARLTLAQARSTLAPKASSLLHLRPINPVHQYKSQMTALRKQFASDQVETQAQNTAIALERRASLLKRQEEIGAEILAFKRERESATLLAADILPGERTCEREGWGELVGDMKTARFMRHIYTLEKHAEKRKEGLTCLLYASRDFVTYGNLDKKLDAAFEHGLVLGESFRKKNLRVIGTDIERNMNNVKGLVDVRARELKSALQGVHPGGQELPTLDSIVNAGDGFEERVSWMPISVQRDGITRLDQLLEGEASVEQDAAVDALYADMERETGVIVEEVKMKEAVRDAALAKLDSLIAGELPIELAPLRRSTIKGYRAQVVVENADLGVVLGGIKKDLRERVVPLVRAQHDSRKSIDELFAKVGEAGVRGVARRSFKVRIDAEFEAVVQKGNGGFEDVVERARVECESVCEEYGREKDE